jgi:hypothetical protein
MEGNVVLDKGFLGPSPYGHARLVLGSDLRIREERPVALEERIHRQLDSRQKTLFAESVPVCSCERRVAPFRPRGSEQSETAGKSLVVSV